MSWYSPIYTRVRKYRQKNPCRGWLLASCLNLLLIVQIVGLCYSCYVYLFHVCGHFITNCVQMTVYLGIYGSLCIMGYWSLMTTIFWPIEKVPAAWKVKKEKLDELKKVTPKEGDRYVVDKSTAEQTQQQNVILVGIAKEQGLVQAECDQLGRLKLCYQCGHMKPDRTHHCSSCGFCVVRFDHHCPWINHCVNHKNYKFFILYLFYAVAIIVWFLLVAVECFVRFVVRQQWSEDWRSLLYILSVFLPFCAFGYYPLGELLLYHWQLMSINETTCEQAKPAVLRNDNSADYNMGRRANIEQIFGWGLWLFPLPTSTEDGMHFNIRYEDATNHLRYRRVELDSSGELPSTVAASQSTSKLTTTTASVAPSQSEAQTEAEDSKLEVGGTSGRSE